MDAKTKKWFILKTKSNFEKKVNASLLEQGFEAYLPRYTTMRVWSDRKKKVEIPLIPSYVFVYCGENQLLEAAKTNGVAWIMKEQREYAVVKDHEIKNLRIFLDEIKEADYTTETDFSSGELVRVTHGPFAGLIGNALHELGEYRVHIEISSLGAGFSISLPKSQLEKIDKTKEV